MRRIRLYEATSGSAREDELLEPMAPEEVERKVGELTGQQVRIIIVDQSEVVGQLTGPSEEVEGLVEVRTRLGRDTTASGLNLVPIERFSAIEEDLPQE